MRSLTGYGFAVILGSCVLFAQDRNGESGRQKPSSRPVDVASPRSPQALPAIDLPEFVITGSASINPPDVNKELHGEDGVYKPNPGDTAPGPRDRETIDLGARFKQSLLSTPEGLYGIAGASLGTFFTGNIFAALGTSGETYDVLTEANYARTKGFTRYADASSGKIGVRGSFVAKNQWALFDQARLGGGASYELSKYKFYGSATPAVQRDWSLFQFHAGGSTNVDAPASLSAALEYRSFGVRDSTAETIENRVLLNASSTVPVFEFPITVGGNLSLSTVTATAPVNLSLASLSVGIPPLAWSDFVIHVSVSGFLVKGMEGQSGSYLYPHLLARYSGIGSHALFFEFAPQVTTVSLEGYVMANPYLSSNTVLRHEIRRWKVSGGMESEWSEWIRTRVEIRAQALDNYPLYADTAGTGFWTLWYGGRTSITTLKLDAVANIGTNDYFAVAFVARSTENSVFGTRVPYVPDIEASAVYRHRFPFHLSVSPSLSFLGARKSGVLDGESVGSCFWSGVRTEYTGISRLSVILDMQNALNRTYEVWRGYKAEPFRMSLGLSYRW